ncbi:DUF3885 domain-containing protein [Rossellomorea marisflavi]|uniref:DUF3885 domain-containing protein n=1 Tax=Rossellomorea TaxID=2837508 RepID=UPI00064EE47E|nr:DUF3885 domain-containing protein [Rossellomorea marisflavi]KMK94883.1 hypothetical protein VL03_08790 [Rossellomorea marisflavi]KML02995.1 hypothetical protein VL06_15145 [Rossellomorea marisflavi]MDR4938024.1 DUF3885 domain-containing protein [Rossellomorea marisflavi]QHA35391.1 DUF3885 domain-containing protein [Rossellomorea marisflavi]TYO71390.1 DUF3885 domain-containing protein [Rossellomorea marisflavi]
MNTHNYLHEHFPGLTLEPPLFYSWPTGLRFEIAKPGSEHLDKDNLEQMGERTTSLFKAVFEQDDDVILVTDLLGLSDSSLPKTNIFLKYIKDKDVRKKLRVERLDRRFDEEDETVTHRFSLQCKAGDIRYRPLLMAICHEDFNHPTRILKNRWNIGIDIYIVNITKHLIYHLYDDRGCDIISAEKDTLLPLYHSASPWILEYDREQINEVFMKEETG